MTIEVLIIIMICDLVVMAMVIYSIITAKEIKESEIEELEIEPIEIKAEEKQDDSIVGVSKCLFLKPPKPKPHPAQVPVKDVPNLFEEEPEMEYYDTEKESDDDNLPEKSEVIETHEQSDEYLPVDEVETTRHMCIDYMNMEHTITRMVRGTVSLKDKESIEQLEGTDLFTQIETLMNTTNLEIVRGILNK